MDAKGGKDATWGPPAPQALQGRRAPGTGWLAELDTDPLLPWVVEDFLLVLQQEQPSNSKQQQQQHLGPYIRITLARWRRWMERRRPAILCFKAACSGGRSFLQGQNPSPPLPPALAAGVTRFEALLARVLAGLVVEGVQPQVTDGPVREKAVGIVTHELLASLATLPGQWEEVMLGRPKGGPGSTAVEVMEAFKSQQRASVLLRRERGAAQQQVQQPVAPSATGPRSRAGSSNLISDYKRELELKRSMRAGPVAGPGEPQPPPPLAGVAPGEEGSSMPPPWDDVPQLAQPGVGPPGTGMPGYTLPPRLQSVDGLGTTTSSSASLTTGQPEAGVGISSARYHGRKPSAEEWGPFVVPPSSAPVSASSSSYQYSAPISGLSSARAFHDPGAAGPPPTPGPPTEPLRIHLPSRRKPSGDGQGEAAPMPGLGAGSGGSGGAGGTTATTYLEPAPSGRKRSADLQPVYAPRKESVEMIKQSMVRRPSANPSASSSTLMTTIPTTTTTRPRQGSEGQPPAPPASSSIASLESIMSEWEEFLGDMGEPPTRRAS